ncbi:hypothetical protein DQ354_07515 [Arthrobacter sp. AQ5-06]|nr:hypothetical protein DQ354_07515 [Arthrobacter sp. AQ5-06]
MAAPFPTSRIECLEADENDQLAIYRNEFDVPGGAISLDGNSLGAGLTPPLNWRAPLLTGSGD